MSLQIIYSVVARNRKIILTDYTEYSGNFQQATLKILSKVEKNTKREIEYPPYTVLYEDIDDVTFILILLLYRAGPGEFTRPINAFNGYLLFIVYFGASLPKGFK